MKLLFALSALLLFLTIVQGKKPNVLFIVCDDLRPNLRFYLNASDDAPPGSPGALSFTPRVDARAAVGAPHLPPGRHGGKVTILPILASLVP